ncbi:histone H2A-like [Lytechinus variegatus]|uniref:histone H2A-like n=1 Tax=Lytechinus variegatus TaxID=7654 RepID=UPI001BB2A86B|nr:histone H2A-like [Lytechinus variegatus]
MSGHDASKGGKVRRKAESRSTRAGLTFPVGRVHRHLRKGRYASRISAAAPVFLAAVLQYLVEELLTLADNERDMRCTYFYLDWGMAPKPKKRINPYHLRQAVGNDDEISETFRGVTIAQGGVYPQKLPAILLPKRKAKECAAAKIEGNKNPFKCNNHPFLHPPSSP